MLGFGATYIRDLTVAAQTVSLCVYLGFQVLHRIDILLSL